jgi:hypothetical protein
MSKIGKVLTITFIRTVVGKMRPGIVGINNICADIGRAKNIA